MNESKWVTIHPPKFDGLFSNLSSVACIVVAGWIIVARGPECHGWGWFLFVGLLLHCSPRGGAKEKP